MKSNLKKWLMIAACILLCSIVLCTGVSLLLRTTFWIGQKAFLYRLLCLEGMCGGLVLLMLIFLFRNRRERFGLSFPCALLSFLNALSLVALFLSLGPMTIERSYTIYTLANMADHAGRVYTGDELRQDFIDGYIIAAKESEKRIEEQVYIGNMEQAEGGYRISGKGARLIRLFRWIEGIFPVPDKNSIYPNRR